MVQEGSTPRDRSIPPLAHTRRSLPTPQSPGRSGERRTSRLLGSAKLAGTQTHQTSCSLSLSNAAGQRQSPCTAAIALANDNHHGAPRGKIPIAAAPWRSAVSCKMVSVTAVLYQLTLR
jgi:hypothetical protein